MNHTDTIKALLDAAQNHIDSLDAYDGDLVPINRTRGTAQELRAAVALTADASEDAPDSVLMDRQYLAGYDAGFMAGERGDGDARNRVHAFRDREIAAALAARPAPVRKGDGND